jgi:hypothetical protein
MPNRTVREGFLDSPKVDLLDWFAECVYHRMLLAADHAGRLDGRSSVLKARLFPLKASLRESDVQRAVNQILKAGLAVSWIAPNGQPVLQLTNWHRDSRATTSRYPDREGRYDIRYVALPAPTEEGTIWVVESSIVSHRNGNGDTGPPSGGETPLPRSHTDGMSMGYVSHSKNDRTINDRTINDGTINVDSSEAKQVRSEPTPPTSSRPVLVFPIVGERKTWELSQEFLDTLAQRYPTLDVLAESRKALAWIEANPSRRKTAKGMPRFLVNWLNRATDSGRVLARSGPPPPAIDFDSLFTIPDKPRDGKQDVVHGRS